MKIKIHILLIFFSFSSAALSQRDSLNMNQILELSLDELLQIEVKVSSTRSTDVFNSPSTVTVIDKQLIEDYNFQSIPEALRILAGVDILQTTIDRNVPTMRGILQNFYSNKVLILINNIPTWQAIYGEGYLDRLDINDIERIEVLKGPASVLYGSNAYTGVINLILKGGNRNDKHIEAYGKAGMPQLGGAGIIANNTFGKLKAQIHLNTSFEKLNPYELESSNTDLYMGDSLYMYQEKNYHSNLTAIFNYNNHTLSYNFFSFDHTYHGAVPSYNSGGGLFVDHKGHLISYQFDKKINKLHYKARVSYDYYKRLHPFSVDRNVTIRLASDRVEGEFKVNYQLVNWLNLEAGVATDYRNSYGHDRISSIKDTLIQHNLVNDNNIFESSIFYQAKFDYQNFAFQFGQRYTYNELFKSNLSSRATLVYNVASKQSIKLIYGQAYRVPTMFELYFESLPYVVGNSSLKPETVESIELAYLFGHNKFYTQVLGYYARYNNLIQRVSESDTISYYRNAHGFDGAGVELEIKYQNPKVINAFANYSYMKGIGDESNTNYSYVPSHFVSVGISKRIGAFSIATNGHFLSTTKGVNEAIPSQFLIDLHLTYTNLVNKANVLHSLSLKNLTNSKMLYPEYIRPKPNINTIRTASNGMQLIYSLKVKF